MEEKTIYLDHAAATPLDPLVFQAMEPYWAISFFNPSALYKGGLQAQQAIASARESITHILRCTPSEIIFTGGGTESNNLAITGVLEAAKLGGIDHPHLIVSAIEHPSVLVVAKNYEASGGPVTYLPVDGEGIVSLDALRAALREETALVSIMYANNEIGTIQPLQEISKIIRHFRSRRSQSEVGTPTAASGKTTPYPHLHTDACQAAGALPLQVDKLGVDLLTLNGAKIYGPKGVGLLYKRRNVLLRPQAWGGKQEQGMRAGTEFVPGIVGLAKALELAAALLPQETDRLVKLRELFLEKLLSTMPERLDVNGHRTLRLPNNINLSFLGLEGERLVIECGARGIAISAGSSCASAGEEPSHVLQALTDDERRIKGAIRITLGRATTPEELEITVKTLGEIASRLTLE